MVLLPEVVLRDFRCAFKPLELSHLRTSTLALYRVWYNWQTVHSRNITVKLIPVSAVIPWRSSPLPRYYRCVCPRYRGITVTFVPITVTTAGKYSVLSPFPLPLYPALYCGHVQAPHLSLQQRMLPCDAINMAVYNVHTVQSTPMMSLVFTV